MLSSREYWELELESLAPGTVRNYRALMAGVLDGLGLGSVEELYELHRGFMLDGDPRSNRVVPHRVARYCRGLVDEGYSTGYVAHVVSAVRHFFLANNLDFPIRRSDLPRVVSSGSRVVLRDEIRRWLELCVGTRVEVRNIALTLVSKDLGFRQSDISRLDVEFVLSARVVDTDEGRFRVFPEFVTQKMGVPAFPHWGPEAEEAVMRYIGDRASGPLFLSVDGKRLSAAAIGMVYGRFKLREGTPKLSHHSLRKFHRTALEARMPESYVKKLQGKKTDPYIHPEQTGELTEAYIRHYDAIRVYREAREVEHLKQELKSQREEHTDLERRLRDAERYIEQQRIEQAVRRELDKQGR